MYLKNISIKTPKESSKRDNKLLSTKKGMEINKIKITDS